MEKIKVAQMIGSVVEGGVESCVMNYYKAIDSTRVEFDFFVDRDSKINDRKQIEALGGKVIITPHYTDIFRYISFVKRKFKENGYDIVHAEMTTLNFIPLLIAKSADIKVRISHGHSTSNQKERIRNLIKNVLRPFSRWGANACFACSEKAGRWLYGDRYYNSGKVTIINNAIELERFRFSMETRQRIREKLAISPETFVVGHIGRFCAQKNHAYLLSIFKGILEKRPDSLLLLVGEGDMMDETKALASSLGISDKVLFLGSQKRPEDFYNAMDVFALPSLYEGLPIVAIEAQTNGLPCFFSTEVTKEANLLDSTEYLTLDDPEEWKGKVSSVTFSEEERLKGYSVMSETKYSIRKEAGKLLELYTSFLEENNPNR